MVCSGDKFDPRQIFEFVKAHQEMYSIAIMGRLLSISTSGYYAWINRPPSARSLRDHELPARIRKIHEYSSETYGRLRIPAELKTAGIRIGGNRVARLMREAGIQGITRRNACRTTGSRVHSAYDSRSRRSKVCRGWSQSPLGRRHNGR